MLIVAALLQDTLRTLYCWWVIHTQSTVSCLLLRHQKKPNLGRINHNFLWISAAVCSSPLHRQVKVETAHSLTVPGRLFTAKKLGVGCDISPFFVTSEWDSVFCPSRCITVKMVFWCSSFLKSSWFSLQVLVNSSFMLYVGPEWYRHRLVFNWHLKSSIYNAVLNWRLEWIQIQYIGWQ